MLAEVARCAALFLLMVPWAFARPAKKAPPKKAAPKATVESLLSSGRERLSREDVAGALDKFFAAARLDRKDPRPYHEVAGAAYATKQYETCLSYESHALELDARFAEASREENILRAAPAVSLAAVAAAGRQKCLAAVGRKPAQQGRKTP